MNQSQSTKIFPRNFKIENYEGMDKLTALEWLFQLEARYQLHACLDDFIDSSHHLTSKEKNYFLNLIVNDYFKNPFKLDRQYQFFSKNHNEDIEICIYTEYEELPHLVTSGAIRPMTIQDFKKINRLYGGLFHSYPNNEPFFKEVIKNDFFEDHLKSIPFYIDLSFSDDILEKEFKRNLANLRTEFKKIKPTKKKLTKYTLAKWASYKLLAFIDLYLWSRINNITIKRPVLSRMLYQYQSEYGEDTLRKSLDPIINRLFQPNGVELEDLENPTHLLDELAILALSNPENN